MVWTDNYSSIMEKIVPLENNKEWRLNVEEHKKTGKMQLNCRVFQKAKEDGGYEGPTKNGFIMPIKSVNDIENLEKMFSDFFKEVKTLL